MKRAQATALLSVGSNSVLIVMKVIVGALSGSISIISEAIHSGMDLIASGIAFFAVRSADAPPDKEHPYGHGKLENVSGVVEAALILVASAIIVAEAVKKIIHPEPVEGIGLGFVVMLISALANILVSRKLYHVAKEEDSVALAADALHLKADVITSLGVGIGLFAIWVAGLFGLNLLFLDPIVAVCIAAFIVREAIGMLKIAFMPLVDHSLPPEEQALVEGILSEARNECGGFHDLRTRQSGKYRQIDCHLTLPPEMTVAKAHQICDRLENEIEAKLKHVIVVIHVEPESDGCADNEPSI